MVYSLRKNVQAICYKVSKLKSLYLLDYLFHLQNCKI
jgi:hypothetical protein